GAHRERGARYDVVSVSLMDLLAEYNAPRRIDYMSVDTEGSELEILKSFDFSRYDVRVMTVEHNRTEKRQLLHDLLTANGFVRKLEQFSGVDDWYVKQY